MTTPLGVPNLPIGALTVETLGEILQDMSAAAMRQRAGDRFPDIFNLSTGGNALNDLTPFGILTSLWAQFNSILANADPEDVQGPEDIPDLILGFIEEMPLVGILVKFAEALGLTPESVEAFLIPIFEFLNWLWELVGQEAETILKPLFEFLNWFAELFIESIEDVLKPLFEFLKSLFETLGGPVLDTIKDLFEYIVGQISFTDLQGFIEQIVTGLSSLLNPQEFVDVLKALFEYFANLASGANGAADIVEQFFSKIPIIGPLVAKLTGLDSSGDTALDLANLGVWAQGLLTQSSGIPAANLIGSIPAAILGAIPVSSINFTAGNLLGQGAFSNSNTVDAGGGWAWDGTTTATGSGGSVKATATGSLQQLYSRQTIKVASGDRVEISAKVKTSGFTSGSMVLAVVPWIGTTAQTPQVIHTRTTTASTFQAMTGSRLRIGGTAEAGEVAISGSITALTVRLGVTANSGAVIWFDDVEVKKAGALAQTLVEYLTTTWEQAWTAVFGSGGTGKIWSDFITTVTTVFDRAKLGVTNAGTAQGTAIGIIDGVGQAIFGDAAYASLPQTTKQSIRKLVGTLFGVSNPVLTEILAAAVPDLDGSVITSGTVDSGFLDTPGIGAAINPTSGSGALLTRKDTANVNANIGRTKFSSGFYTHLDVASTDISAMTTAGVPGTGARSDYSGIFRVANAGWYLCEISVRLNASFSFDWKIAPVLYKGTTLSDLAVYKVGTDSQVGCRYAQSSFIVYLSANHTVQAGFDGAGYAVDLFDADLTGAETYFSISLLNKTYA